MIVEKRLRLIRLCLIGLIGLLSAACSGGSALERQSNEGLDLSRLIPQPTPFRPQDARNYELTMLDGTRSQLSQLIGREQIVVINFWATWCGPCRREIPELVALDREFEGQGIKIIGLSPEDPQQIGEVIKIFADQYSIKYLLGYTTEEMLVYFNGTAQGLVIPQTFIFGRDGNLLGHIRGVSPYYREMVREVVRRGLKA